MATIDGINAKYIRYMKLEESIVKQKTQLHWFIKRDSKYFHALMRGRKKSLFIHKVHSDNDVWVHADEKIATATCNYF